MKKILTILVLFLGLAVQVYAQDYPKLAAEARKRGEWDLAIGLRQKAYDQNPTADNLCWLAFYLYNDGHFTRVLRLLEAIPRDTWYSSAYDTETFRYYAMALGRMGRPNEAARIIYEAIAKNGKRQELNYEILFMRRDGMALRMIDDVRFAEIFQKYLESIRKNPGASKSHARTVYQFCLIAMLKQFEAGDIEAARYLVSIAIEMAPIVTDDPSLVTDAEIFRQALEFAAQKPKIIPVEMKFLGRYYRGSDADVTDAKGVTVHVKNYLDDAQVNVFLAVNRVDAELAAFLYFYFSDGALRLTFDFRPVDATIKQVRNGSIVHDETSPSPGTTTFQEMNNFDGFIEFYDDALVPGSWSAGNYWPMLIPYTLGSSGIRFGAWLRSGGDYTVYRHELFHTLECVFPLKPAHGSSEGNKASWPPEYAKAVEKLGRTDATLFYQIKFREVMNPLGFERVKLRQSKPETIVPAVFNRLLAGFEATPIEKIRKSNDLYLEGYRQRVSKNLAAARDLFAEALALYPWHYRAHRELLALYRDNFSEAPEAFSVYTAYFERFSAVAQIWTDAGLLEQILKVYLKNAEYDECRHLLDLIRPAYAQTFLASMLDYYEDRTKEAAGNNPVSAGLNEKGGVVGFDAGSPPVFLYSQNIVFGIDGERPEAKFNGVDSFMDLGARAFIRGSGAFSIRASFKSRANGKAQVIVQQRSRQGFNGEYMLYLAPDGTLVFFVYGDGRTQVSLASPASLHDGLYHDVVAVRKASGEAVLYIDGSKAASVQGKPASLIPLQVFIGADRLDNEDYFLGSIRSVEVVAADLSESASK